MKPTSVFTIGRREDRVQVIATLTEAVVVTVGIAALAAWAIITDDQPNPATATQLAAVGASVGQFGLVALAITSEFATGSIRTTLAATPARWAMLTAKATVVGAVTGRGPAQRRWHHHDYRRRGAVRPPILGALLSNEVVATVMDYLPAGLTTVLVSSTGEGYSPEVAALLLGAWAIGALAAGVIALHRRDP